MEVTRLPISEARDNLRKFAERAQAKGEAFILERNGVPLAAIISADEFEDFLDTHDPEAAKRIKVSHEDYLAGRTRPAEELLHRPI